MGTVMSSQKGGTTELTFSKLFSTSSRSVWMADCKQPREVVSKAMRPCEGNNSNPQLSQYQTDDNVLVAQGMSDTSIYVRPATSTVTQRQLWHNPPDLSSSGIWCTHSFSSHTMRRRKYCTSAESASLTQEAACDDQPYEPAGHSRARAR